MDETSMPQPFDDDQPLFLPEEFEREHLDDARRSVANSRGGRAVARRVTAAAELRPGSRGRSPFGIALLVHAVAALMVITITVATGTWFVGIALLGLVGVSLAVVARVLRVLAVKHAPASPPPAPRPHPRRPS